MEKRRPADSELSCPFSYSLCPSVILDIATNRCREVVALFTFKGPFALFTLPISIFRDIGVCGIEGMPAQAMRLPEKTIGKCWHGIPDDRVQAT